MFTETTANNFGRIVFWSFERPDIILIININFFFVFQQEVVNQWVASKFKG